MGRSYQLGFLNASAFVAEGRGLTAKMQFSPDEFTDPVAVDPEQLEEDALKVAARRGGWDSGIVTLEGKGTVEFKSRPYAPPTFAPTNATEWLAAMTLDAYGPRLKACGLRSMFAFQSLAMKPMFTDLS